MIESLFDDAVVVHLADPDMEPGPVMGAESGYLEAMRPSRLREFSGGRSSARSALTPYTHVGDLCDDRVVRRDESQPLVPSVSCAAPGRDFHHPIQDRARSQGRLEIVREHLVTGVTIPAGRATVL